MSEKFWNERAEWSIATFGPVDERGPMGPVLHLKEEVDEALEHLNNSPYDKSKFVEELVDCLFLIEDAAMRVGCRIMISITLLLLSCKRTRSGYGINALVMNL